MNPGDDSGSALMRTDSRMDLQLRCLLDGESVEKLNAVKR